MVGQSFNVFAMMSVCLYVIISLIDEPREVGDRSTTYLRLVQVDEYLRMTQWTTTAIAGHNAFLSPSYWLFVNEIDSG